MTEKKYLYLNTDALIACNLDYKAMQLTDAIIVIGKKVVSELESIANGQSPNYPNQEAKAAQVLESFKEYRSLDYFLFDDDDTQYYDFATYFFCSELVDNDHKTAVTVQWPGGLEKLPSDMWFIADESEFFKFNNGQFNNEAFNYLVNETENGEYRNLFSIFGLTYDIPEYIAKLKADADKGCISALVTLGNCYLTGQFVGQDPESATKCYQKAAETGLPKALYNLGNCYFNGFGVEQNFSKAVELFTQAAEQGNAEAQYNLAICYFEGGGVAQDPQEALKWFTKAAEQGIAEAQSNLGFYYLNGMVVELNTQKGIEWLTKGAKQGSAFAQHNLGICYGTGQGVEQNAQTAVEWLTKAAEQGFVDSIFEVGKCYYRGEGCEKDLSFAKELFEQAAAEGHKGAEEMLKRM